MEHEIPMIVKLLYAGMVTGPDPSFWPEEMKDDPIRGHGLWTFYSGLRMGLQLGAACLWEP
ncbi:hypothetical protein N510_000617 [Firmicutes bacterium ASF500]|nr:hypothetical protein N510_000617 [Firmicutes bacterium ASF500]